MNITGSVNGKEPKKYYKYINIAKGFSIILIVMGHIESGFFQNPPSNTDCMCDK